jgi:hypothetical protein
VTDKLGSYRVAHRELTPDSIQEQIMALGHNTLITMPYTPELKRASDNVRNIITGLR